MAAPSVPPRAHALRAGNAPGRSTPTLRRCADNRNGVCSNLYISSHVSGHLSSHVSGPINGNPGRPNNHRVIQQGFSLIELMIVVVIMGVLLAVAYPSYIDSVRKGRRADGIAGLTAVQQAQERYRANSPTYGNLAAVADAATLPNAARLRSSPNARYALAVTGNGPAGYTVLATAQGNQADDTRCAVMGVRAVDGNLRYGSAASTIDWTAADADAGNCWAK